MRGIVAFYSYSRKMSDSVSDIKHKSECNFFNQVPTRTYEYIEKRKEKSGEKFDKDFKC